MRTPIWQRSGFTVNSPNLMVNKIDTTALVNDLRERDRLAKLEEAENKKRIRQNNTMEILDGLRSGRINEVPSGFPVDKKMLYDGIVAIEKERREIKQEAFENEIKLREINNKERKTDSDIKVNDADIKDKYSQINERNSMLPYRIGDIESKIDRRSQQTDIDKIRLSGELNHWDRQDTVAEKRADTDAWYKRKKIGIEAYKAETGRIDAKTKIYEAETNAKYKSAMIDISQQNAYTRSYEAKTNAKYKGAMIDISQQRADTDAWYKQEQTKAKGKELALKEKEQSLKAIDKLDGYTLAELYGINGSKKAKIHKLPDSAEKAIEDAKKKRDEYAKIIETLNALPKKDRDKKATQYAKELLKRDDIPDKDRALLKSSLKTNDVSIYEKVLNSAKKVLNAIDNTTFSINNKIIGTILGKSDNEIKRTEEEYKKMFSYKVEDYGQIQNTVAGIAGGKVSEYQKIIDTNRNMPKVEKEITVSMSSLEKLSLTLARVKADKEIPATVKAIQIKNIVKAIEEKKERLRKLEEEADKLRIRGEQRKEQIYLQYNLKRKLREDKDD